MDIFLNTHQGINKKNILKYFDRLSKKKNSVIGITFRTTNKFRNIYPNIGFTTVDIDITKENKTLIRECLVHENWNKLLKYMKPISKKVKIKDIDLDYRKGLYKYSVHGWNPRKDYPNFKPNICLNYYDKNDNY